MELNEFGKHKFDGYSDIWETEIRNGRYAQVIKNNDGEELRLFQGDFFTSKPLNRWSLIKAKNWLVIGVYEIPASEYQSTLQGIHQISSSAWKDNYSDAFDQINELCGDILG